MNPITPGSIQSFTTFAIFTVFVFQIFFSKVNMVGWKNNKAKKIV